MSLLAELTQIAEQGYAVDHEEFAAGVSGFAVIVNTYLGQYALAAVVPSFRTKDQQRLVTALQACKAQIERKLA
ncbi:IclR family transcriptional regulator C-terminal domain-containing protein [Rheinheimera sp. MMS21-TC3]|uniref:IclR family transcriptional regulator domain-containing protein n=1 Tax=Rheinheimera sp. MMS21-TC3 TaxID=3072790 RepID=UPI0028C4E096|nr:IclR family transcriptional regulator C-terminal domain-containing protein [Rheinheimera sp. MMS21-TC3]WNO62276.1 IclR family transcriptional regulator C-terminal domain-containing protein [Rheinheimera sp. MMS21-TC3]